MSVELSAMQKQCEQYQLAVNKLSKQVSKLALLMHEANQRTAEREELLLNQLHDLRNTLEQWY
jgi:predicted  nucleic acid-binding Zn-ribbon protein